MFRLYVGTKNIVALCIKHNVQMLIYTSSASITLSGYLGKAPYAVVINQTESKASLSDSDFMIPGYAMTKSRAERIVLGANGTNLANGTGNIQIFAQHYNFMSIDCFNVIHVSLLLFQMSY